MNSTKITCLETGKTVEAEVLAKSAKHLRVVLANNNLPLSLYKRDFQDKNYIGRTLGMEFVSTGE